MLQRFSFISFLFKPPRSDTYEYLLRKTIEIFQTLNGLNAQFMGKNNSLLSIFN